MPPRQTATQSDRWTDIKGNLLHITGEIRPHCPGIILFCFLNGLFLISVIYFSVDSSFIS